jgi:hypothetical protein
VSEYDQVKIKTLYTCCEQAGRGGTDYETKPLKYEAQLDCNIQFEKLSQSGSFHTSSSQHREKLLL